MSDSGMRSQRQGDLLFEGAEEVAYDGACVKCHGTGVWQYDDNHGCPCPNCCTHPQGWWKLTSGYGATDAEYAACYRPGCGTTISKAEWGALAEDMRHA